LTVGGERDGQDDNVSLDCLLNAPRDKRRADLRRERRKRLQRPPSRDGHFDPLSGERASDSHPILPSPMMA
jgi:hypothetical protein